jgi:lipopolysaccharide transport system permease protein
MTALGPALGAPLAAPQPRRPERSRRLFDLIAYKAFAELRAESSRTFAGYLWWILEPLLTLAVYALVFGAFLRRGGPDYVPFLAIGITVFRWFSVSVSRASDSLWHHRGLIERVAVPKFVFPAAAVLADGAKVAFLFAVLLGFLCAWGIAPSAAWVSGLPALTAVTLLFVLGQSTLFAALVPFVPDLQLLLTHALRLLAFVSGIFFAIEEVPPDYHFLVAWNPLARLIDAFRRVLLAGEAPPLVPLLWIGLGSAACLALGLALLARFDRSYPKLGRSG